MPSRVRHAAAIVLVAFLLTACPGGGAGVAPAVLGVTITNTEPRVLLGGTVALQANVQAVGGASEALAWESDAEGVVEVDATGVVTGVTVGTATITATSVADPTRSASVAVRSLARGTALWTRQFGVPQGAAARAVAVGPEGEVAVAGTTFGAFVGVHQGLEDVFVRRYLADGALDWTRQFGTDVRDVPLAVAVGPAGEVAVGGFTYGVLENGYVGPGNAFVRVLDAAGEVLWTRQFGSVENDAVGGLAWTGDGDLIAAGWTLGATDYATAFVRRFDPDGGLLWDRQFDLAPGIVYDAVEAVAVGPAGEIVVAGRTADEAFVRRLDAAGELCPDVCWTRPIANAGSVVAEGVAVDAAGRVAVAGWTDAALAGASSEGSDDAFVRVYQSSGDVAWTRQFGSIDADRAMAVAFTPQGRVVTAGHTLGALAGGGQAGWDAFVRSYPADGGTPWTRQIATAGEDRGWDVAADALGDVVVAGQVGGLLEGAYAGSVDAFVRKYGP
jgi:hypothetical protein